MKKYILYIITGLLLVSCEDVLDTKKQNEWTDVNVWRDPRSAEGVLMKAYSPIQNRPDSYENNFTDCATDNAVTNSYGVGVYRMGQGNVSVYDNPLDIWSTAYEQFQNIHQFLDHGLNDSIQYVYNNPDKTAEYKVKLKGEAHFLRAYWGFQLLKIYGGKTDSGKALGYPIVLHFITTDEAANPQNFVRNTYQECVDQIVSDCDSAIAKLPAIYGPFATNPSDVITGDQFTGRATSAAAAILKVNALLYGASLAYQPDEIVKINDKGNNDKGNYTIVDEAAYEKKWERVALFADSVLQSTGGKFGDYSSGFYALTANDLSDFSGGTSMIVPAEFVWRRFFNNSNMEKQHYPPFYLGNANTTPSQNLVDAFPMTNGYPVSDIVNSGYDPQDPYKNRDKRFAMNICYHGMKFTSDKSRPANQSTAADTLDIVYGGKDSRSFDPKATRTGYYLGKFIARTADLLVPTINVSTPTHNNPLLRKAEVFLAFAEASNEAWGPMAKGPNCKYSSYDVIKDVRSKSGGISNTAYLDQMATDKDNFRTLIQNECRLEFAFENHRYFDMRRWLLPLNESVRGVEITRNPDSSLQYNVIEVEKRNMNEIRYYYLPLPYNEVLKNPNMENNLGWN